MQSFSLNTFFVHDDSEFKSNARCREVCAWIVKHGRKPSTISEDPAEKAMGVWCYIQTKAKKANKFYHSNQAISEEYNLHHLFDTRSREEKSNLKCHELCQWVIANGRRPSSRARDQVESQLQDWLKVQIRAKNNKTKKSTFYQSNLNIAEEYGLGDIFDRWFVIKTLEKNSNTKCHELCRWIITNERLPSRYQNADALEIKLYDWLSTKIKAKRMADSIKTQNRQGKGLVYFYNSDQQIAKNYGLENLFQPAVIDLEKESNTKCHLLCRWIKEHERLPSGRRQGEKQLSRYLAVKKRALQNKGTHKFYLSDQAIAESHGLINLFKTQSK